MAKEKPQGIGRFLTALVYEASYQDADQSRDVYQADAPSTYAEARLGVASRKEIETELEKLVDSINSRKYRGDIPFFRQWLKENKGELDISDLEKIARKRKKSAALVTEEAIEEANQSDLGTLTARIKARSSGVSKDTLKYWDAMMSNYTLVEKNAVNPSFRRDCNCRFKGKHTNRRRLWSEKLESEKRFIDDLVEHKLVSRKEMGRELHISCYHEVCLKTGVELQNNRGVDMGIKGLEKPTTIAFDFIDRWDLVFEAFARRYKYKQNYGEIDEFLFSQDVISPYFQGMIGLRMVNKEVIRKPKHFRTMQRRIIMELHRKFLDQGFNYKGFANEFQDDVRNRKKDYKTIAIVYEDLTKNTSYHVVIDDTFWMPFVVEKNFMTFEGDRKPSVYQINPLNTLYTKKRKNRLYMFDDRTQRVAEIRMLQPTKIASGIEGAIKGYQRYRRGFLKHKK